MTRGYTNHIDLLPWSGIKSSTTKLLCFTLEKLLPPLCGSSDHRSMKNCRLKTLHNAKKQKCTENTQNTQQFYVETLNRGKPQATNIHYILDIQERTNYNTLCTYYNRTLGVSYHTTIAPLTLLHPPLCVCTFVVLYLVAL